MDKDDDEDAYKHEYMFEVPSFCSENKYNPENYEEDCEKFSIKAGRPTDCKSINEIHQFEDEEQLRRTFDAKLPEENRPKATKPPRKMSPIYKSLKGIEVPHGAKSETGDVGKDLTCQEKLELKSKYSMSSFEGTDLQRFPYHKPIFKMAAPAAGLTMPGPIKEYIKYVVLNKISRGAGGWQLYYACYDPAGTKQCPDCYKYVTIKEWSRHIKGKPCDKQDNYKFPLYEIAGSKGKKYFCPFGCGFFKFREDLVNHLATPVTHSKDDLKKFGYHKGILGQSSSKQFESRADSWPM